MALVDTLAGEITKLAAVEKHIAVTTRDRLMLVFIDPREEGSMLLSQFGWEILKDRYPHWSIRLSRPLTFGDLTFLIETSSFPYYLGKTELTTFDADLGVTMKLMGGDFEQLKKLRNIS